MSAAFTPESITELLSEVLRSDIRCVPHGDSDSLRLDTPYLLQDGHSLRVFLRKGEQNGDIIASDGGFATEQIESYFDTPAAQRHRYVELHRIAVELGLDWDVDFSFSEADLKKAIKRIADLAQAVDRALTMVQPKTEHIRTPLVGEVGKGLRAVGLEVTSPAKIAVPHGQPVQVDHRARSPKSEAAIEILSGASVQGASQAVDSAIAEFHILHGAEYPGILIAVYDENSKMQMLRLRQRFQAAKPKSAHLIPGRRAIPQILELLAS